MNPLTMNTHTVYLIIAAGLLLAILVGVLALLYARRLERQFRQRCETLEAEVSRLTANARSMGQRLLAQEQHLSTTTTSMTNETTDSYRQAAHLLATGLSADELASRCGLSRAEISLLDALRKDGATDR